MVNKGINRALRNPRTNLFCSESKKGDPVPCIFISYQRKDEEYAEDVANHIMNKGLDVYFDKNDEDLRFAKQTENPKDVTRCITTGINRSDYMLVIVSARTLDSPWVPFEIGYAYEEKVIELNILKHKGITKLPQYLETANVFEGYKSLDTFISRIMKNRNLTEIKRYRELERYLDHPLSKYLADQ